MQSAMLAASPGMRYTIIMNKIIIARPIVPAKRLVRIASWPSLAPTTCERTSSSLTGRAPILIVDARLSADS